MNVMNVLMIFPRWPEGTLWGDATFKFPGLIEFTQRYQTDFVGFTSISSGFKPHAFDHAQDLDVGLLNHDVRTDLTNTHLVHTNHFLGGK